MPATRLYIPEREVARLLGADVTWLRANSAVLEANGFPKVDPLVGKRHLPSIEAWAAERNSRFRAPVERLMMWKKEMERRGRSPHYIKKWFTHLGLPLSHGKKLGLEDCARIRSIREEMRIRTPAARTEYLTREQAEQIIAEADRRGWGSLSLAIMFRFEYMLRGVDVYGEWQPAEGRRGGIQRNGKLWAKGLTWEMFEPDLSSFTKVISKTARSMPEPYRFDVIPSIRRRLAQIPESHRVGPVIVMEDGYPPKSERMTHQFKTLVRALGLPDSLRMADARAGGITEAKSLVDPYTLRDAAQHTQVNTTDRYVRGRSDAANKVVQLRGKNP